MHAAFFCFFHLNFDLIEFLFVELLRTIFGVNEFLGLELCSDEFGVDVNPFFRFSHGLGQMLGFIKDCKGIILLIHC